MKSAAHTFLNIQATAVDWIKDHVETRRELRRGRRFRTTPCRANRRNRAKGGLPPSTKARWQWKLRLCRWLARRFPITAFVVEDIKAKTQGQRRWDIMFSPLEVGKQWLYAELGRIAPVHQKSGWETKRMREALGLKKVGRKTAEVFDAHCVDSWVRLTVTRAGTSSRITPGSCVSHRCDFIVANFTAYNRKPVVFASLMVALVATASSVAVW